MIFWNLNKLIQAHQQGTLSAKEERKYTITAVIVLLLALPSFFFIDSSTFNRWDAIDLALFIIINVAGAIIAYRINKTGDGQKFAIRYLSLSIPIMIRYIILFTILTSIIYSGIFPLTDEEWIATNKYDVTASFIVELYFNYLMITSVRKIARYLNN